MPKDQKLSRRAVSRIAVFAFIAVTLLTITAAGASSSRFPFLDSVREFFGLANINMSSAAENDRDDETHSPLAGQFWNTNGTVANWTAANWGTSAAGPFTNVWTSNSDATFTADSIITFVTTTQVGNIAVTNGSTITVNQAGTLSTNGNVRTFDVGAGSILDFNSQSISTTAGTGIIKSGQGIYYTGNANLFPGGFTLNDGIVILGTINAMGGGGPLTINGGTLATTSTGIAIPAPKYTSVTIGGNFTMGAVTSNVPSADGSSTGNISIADPISLGVATRTITIGSNAKYTLSGAISGNSGVGVTVANAPGATGTLVLLGANTYTGDTRITGGKLSLGTGGSIAASPNIIIDGGASFDVSTKSTAVTLASGQGLVGSGTTSTGTIVTAATKGITTGANSPLQFTAFNGSTPPLTLSGSGTLALQSGNPVTVKISNGGVPLAPGVTTDYKLIAKGTGSVTGTPTSLTLTGTLPGDGVIGTPSVVNIGGELFLHVVPATPTINLSTTFLPGFGSVVVGATSTEQSYTVSGTSLSANISIAAPTDYQISTTGGGVGFGPSVTLTQSGGTVATTTIFVRFAPGSTGPKSGKILHDSTGVTTQSVSVNGTGIPAGPTKFAITAITPSLPTAGNTFDVTVQSQDAGSNPSNVIVTTGFTLSTNGNAGTIGGTTTGGITAGQSSATVTGVTLSTGGTGATLTVTRTSGDVLTAGASAAFTVLAAEPSVAPSALNFTAITPNSMTVNWTNGNGSTRIVLARQGSVTANPVDGTTYTDNAAFGSGSVIFTDNFVVYKGTGTSVNVTGLLPSTTYNFNVLEFNGSGGTENYLTTAAAFGGHATAATTCTSVATGLWNNPAVWSNCGGTFPQAADNAVIDNSTTVTLDAARTGANVTVNGGSTLDAASNTLTVSSAFTLAANSTFKQGGSGTTVPGATRVFDNASTYIFNGTQTSITGSFTFGNLIWSAGNATPNGNLQVNGNLTITAGSLSASAGTTSRVHGVNGNVVVDGATTLIMGTNGTSGTGTWTILGSVTTQNGGTLRSCNTGSGADGVFNIAGNLTNNGSVEHGTGTGAFTINFNGFSPQTISGNAIATLQNFGISNGSGVSLSTNVTATGNVSISGSGAFIANASTINVGGNWSNLGLFNGGTSTVNFNGATGQTITGQTSFYNFAKSVAAAQTLNFTNGSLTTATNSLTFVGAAGQLLSLRSTTPGSQWVLVAPAGTTASFVDVQDSSNIGTEITPTGFVDSGNNAGWNFFVATAPTVTTNAATSVTSGSANLNGTANPNGSATTGWFRYSPTSPGTCNDSFGTRAPAFGGADLGPGISSVPYLQSIVGLLPGTTYYYCAIANNIVGTGFGAVLSFTTPALTPTVTTGPSTGVASTFATMNAIANPNGAATTGWFRYSTTNPGTCDDTFGTRAPVSGGTDLGAGTSIMPFLQSLTGLAPATTYYFCGIAENSIGKSFGVISNFTTLPGAPTVTTNAATSVTAGTANLNGAANPNGAATTGYFRYSTSDPGTCNDVFGTRAPGSGGSSLPSGTSSLPYMQGAVGFAPGTKYYFCAIASNTAGTGFGAVLNFTTPALAPSVTTGPSTGVASTFATMNAIANPNGAATTAWFRYSTTNPVTCDDTFGTRAPASGGTDLGAGTSIVPFLQDLTGLAPATTYYFCGIAENSIGKSFGVVSNFTTQVAAPTVTTTAATLVTAATATLNGAANPNGDATTGWFRYSTTSPGTCNDSFGTRAPVSGGTALGAGTLSASYSQGISGLAAGTTYYYCAIASNSLGTSFGGVLSFTTMTPTPTVTNVSPTFGTTGGGTSVTITGTGFTGDGTSVKFGGTAATGVTVVNDTQITATTPAHALGAVSVDVTTPGGTNVANTLYTYIDLPTVTTVGATSLSSTSATLSGSANPNGSNTTGWFRYATSSPGTCNDTFGTRAPAAGGSTLGAGSPVPYSQGITGLTVGTQYFYCAIAQNSAGTSFGSVLSFTTTTPGTLSFKTEPYTDSETNVDHTFTVTIQRTGGSNGVVGVTYATSAGTATAGTDYVQTTNTLSWADGDTADKTFNVTIKGDTLYEADETVNLTLSAATGGAAISGTNPTTLTITNDDTAPTISISDVTQAEGEAGTTLFNFNVSLSAASGLPVTVHYRTADGTATAGSDYVGIPDTILTIPAGNLSAPQSVPGNVHVTVNGDTVYEGNETFFVNLTNPLGATIADSQGVGTINDDTDLPSISIDDVTHNEGDSGTTSYVFTVTKTGATNLPATFDFVTNDGSATQPDDYAFNSGTGLTFAPAETTKQITVLVNGDTAIEPDETFTVHILDAVGATAVNVGTGTIINDDGTTVTNAATLVTSSTATLNGSSNPNGSATTGWFRYSTTSPSTCNDTFGTRAPVAGGTALGVGSSPVQYSQGISGLIPATTYYYCAIAQNALNTTFGAVLNFTTQAAPSTVQFASATLMQDESQTAVIIVSRTGDTSGTTTVNLTDLGTGNATSGAACGGGADYGQLSPNPRLLTFGPAVIQQTVNIPICSDNLPDNLETVNFALSCVTNCSLGALTNETLTINDTASTYRNTTPINFVPGGPADQYPSTITVSGGPAVNGAIRVTMYDVWHGIPDNVDILLVGPNGHKYVLMADAGGSVPIGPTAPVTLTFSDSASSVLPDSTALSMGTFKPTTWTTPIANFPAPAPVGPYVEPGSVLARPVQQSMFGQFGLVTTNGDWNLYVRDDNQPPAPAGNAPEGTSVGMIAGGWGIEFQAPTAAGVSVSGRVLTPDGRGLRNATVWMTDSQGVRRLVMSNSLGLFIFEDVPAGETYLIGVSSKHYRFTTRVLQVFDSVADVELTGLE